LTSGQITLSNNVAIDASSLPAGIRISGNSSSRVFAVLPGVNACLTGLTIWRGYAPNGSYPTNSGGGILNQGTLTLSNCVVVNNQAVQAGDSSGGGIENNNGALTIHNSTISSNSASSYGGGIDSYNSSTMTINQSTVAGNSAGNQGGGIYSGNSTLTLNHSTLTANSASNSGGGINNSSTFNLYNSIVAGNDAPAGPDINNTGTLIPTGVNLTNGIPLLAPLGDYGGPTPTMPALPGSPAINGCTNGTTFALDQRGLPRVVGAFADLGAVEGVYNPAMSLTDPIELANGSFRFFFNNLSGPDYTVLASPNVTLPLNLWSNLGLAIEISPGTYVFTDLQATNYSRRFYTVRTP